MSKEEYRINMFCLQLVAILHRLLDGGDTDAEERKEIDRD